MSDKTTPWTHHSFHPDFPDADEVRDALCKKEGYAEPKEGNPRQVKVRLRNEGAHAFEIITRSVSPTHYANLRKAGDPAGAGAIVSREADSE